MLTRNFKIIQNDVFIAYRKDYTLVSPMSIKWQLNTAVSVWSSTWSSTLQKHLAPRWKTSSSNKPEPVPSHLLAGFIIFLLQETLELPDPITFTCTYYLEEMNLYSFPCWPASQGSTVLHNTLVEMMEPYERSTFVVEHLDDSSSLNWKPVS